MGNKFTVENTVNFTAPRSIFYKRTDIMEYCWNRLTYCDEVDINEILADAENILISKNMTIGRFMEIIKSLRREGSDSTFTSYTPKDCDGMTMDDIFGEGDYVDCEESTDDDGITIDNCCCETCVDFDEFFNTYITLADLNCFFGTLNLNSDDPESDCDIIGEDSVQCVFENSDEYDKVMDELLNDYSF